MMKRKFLLLIILAGLSSLAMAQNDSIITKAGDVLTGEIKSMQNGVLFMDTPYADADFNISWTEIDKIFSIRTHLLTLENGDRLYGTMNSRRGDSDEVVIQGEFGELVVSSLLEITFLDPLSKSFIGRLSASVEVGYSFTKANNYHQFNTRSSLGYNSEKWNAYGSVDAIRSRQDSVAPTRRTDASIGVTLLLGRSWYVALSNDFLQNNEQKLRLRSTTNLSAGRMLVNTYRTYWGIGLGAALNMEDFTTDIPSETSMEGLVSSEFNMFAFDDVSLYTILQVYPSFTVQGRIRADYKFDVKYDLPLDFFIKFGFTVNYDSKPTAGASDIDYVIQTTFGWEL